MHRKKRKKEKKGTEKDNTTNLPPLFLFPCSLSLPTLLAPVHYIPTRLTHHQAENQLFLLLFQPIIVKPLRS